MNFTVENIGDWFGFESEVAEELNEIFRLEWNGLYTEIDSGEQYSWDSICNDYHLFLSAGLTAEIREAEGR